MSLAPGVLLSLAAVYSIWSSTFLALRYMVSDLPPLATSGARFLLAGSVLYAFLRLRGAAAPTLKQWALCVSSGTLMFFAGNGFVAIAAREVPSGITAMSIGSVPLFLTAMEVALGQRPSRRQWLGIALGFLGVLSVGVSDAPVSRQSLLLLLLAPIGWAAASLVVRHCSLAAGPMAGAAQLIGGGATLLIGGFVLGERFVAWPASSSLFAFGYLVLFGSIIGYSAAMHLLRSAPASLATSYAYVNPVLALVLGATLGGERVGPNLLFAGFLVVAGVAVLVTSSREGASRVDR
jgi:drug/metabolite transporter (DMT)-like permease